MPEFTPLLVSLIVFASVMGVVFIVGRYFTSEAMIQRRLTIPLSPSDHAHERNSGASKVVAAIAEKLNQSRLGVSGILRNKLRRDLIRAGFFSDNAINIYVVVRLCLLLIVPTTAFIYLQLFSVSWPLYIQLGIVVFITLLCFLGPDAYISSRQGTMQAEYRLNFPDLLDMLVVCVDAGLALEAALSRVRSELSKSSAGLGMNLGILSAETRAGRSLPDALGNFADRLNLDEARALVAMLRQSVELGTDIGDALRAFSDEMRGRRLLRAEETANKLPVKMVLPLGLFIFPVILMVIMIPVMIRLLSVFRQVH